MVDKSYIKAVKTIKSAILQSRYDAASLVNKELILLYFFIGKYVSYNSRNKNWGSGAIELISQRLQQELPGLRGFSATNIKNMRLFYEEWHFLSDNLSSEKYSNLIINEEVAPIRQLPTGDLSKTNTPIRQLATDDLHNDLLKKFMNIGFTHHIIIITKSKSQEEKIFYIERAALERWSISNLKYQIKSKLFKKRGKLPNNFNKTLTDAEFRHKALMSFKDELLLDFINIEDADDEIDERVLENEIIQNIKKFIMAIGPEFSFIGNQYRLAIDEEEFFVDLLFFNRKIQSLVAIELKKGKFKAEYAGKMNLYLSALDEYVKQDHENPSIGIILCKEKNNKVVEFAFRDTSKPMGVVTFKTSKQLPKKYKNVLPDPDKLRELF